MTENQCQDLYDSQMNAEAPPASPVSELPGGERRDEQCFLQIAGRIGIGVLCLLALSYIAQGDTGWSRRAQSYLHLAVNASTGQTFGKLIRSPALQTIMTNSRNLLRMEHAKLPLLPKLAGGVMAEAVWPLQGKLLRRFGWFQPLPGQERRFSKGIVLAGRSGEAVVAIYSGRVIKVEREPTFGWIVALEHSEGLRSFYHNLGQITVRLNQTVATGELLGNLKSTSKPQELLLGLEVYEADRLIDPLTVIGPG
jgi:murein DD-endopeptidase MepM/ murein hydrolase activator NlpD